ncbi:hypothetical protein A2257_01400 [Candidatus Falkowbacteria bacterium RIFOXYA2_FULL_38_12]|uniref:Uncharacterized protein n=1 Tax=Candidatus Falkowbacteria bacterium RIFOXYA2_FULL_38_12 TaxID=1797993 RepID=A0A1F5S374_9BACT|nr:MAG: hypothetical protein A2257_01400 [Candidatus Falkowbacteria bacterium RIFOXYA2_FULL_38_12]
MWCPLCWIWRALLALYQIIAGLFIPQKKIKIRRHLRELPPLPWWKKIYRNNLEKMMEKARKGEPPPKLYLASSAPKEECPPEGENDEGAKIYDFKREKEKRGMGGTKNVS